MLATLLPSGSLQALVQHTFEDILISDTDVKSVSSSIVKETALFP